LLIESTADRNPVARGWAIRLLGELHSVESARAVIGGLLDSDEEVREAALIAARQLQSNSEARAAISEGLGQLASDSTQADSVRQSAVRAAAQLRESSTVPMLIGLLGGPSALVPAAHQALVEIARQDFAHNRAPWQRWWEANQSRHRIEWLIDSLTHDDAEIRRSAGDELKSLTKEYFGYYDDLPRRERAQAQRRYREWWQTDGRKRFAMHDG
jgi:HEAT repeat protein